MAQATSDEQGLFAFAVTEVPEVGSHDRLWLAQARWHGSRVLHIRRVSLALQVPLGRGVIDIGDVRLCEPTLILSGRVLGEHGLLAKAKVEARGATGNGEEMDVRLRGDGTFEIWAPDGNAEVVLHATAPGYEAHYVRLPSPQFGLEIVMRARRQ